MFYAPGHPLNCLKNAKKRLVSCENRRFMDAKTELGPLSLLSMRFIFFGYDAPFGLSKRSVWTHLKTRIMPDFPAAAQPKILVPLACPLRRKGSRGMLISFAPVFTLSFPRVAGVVMDRSGFFDKLEGERDAPLLLK